MGDRLFRSRQIFLKSKTLDRKTQGFLYDLVVGFEGTPDSESGMILNLKEIDGGLEQVCQNLQKKVSGKNESQFLEIVHLLHQQFTSQKLVHISLSSQNQQTRWIWDHDRLFQEHRLMTSGADYDGTTICIEIQIYCAVIKGKQSPVGLRVHFLARDPEVFEIGETF